MSVQRSRLGLWITLPLVVVVAACSGGEGAGGGAGGADAAAGPGVSIQLDASYAEAFSYLSGVREMPDGTLMAADPLGQVLLRVDMDTQTADTLGRTGEGPGEYQQPDQVFPLPGDSTLLVDLGNGRLTFIDTEGQFVEGIPIAQEAQGGGGMMRMNILMPRFLDARGNLYYSANRGMEAEPPDSTAAVRYDRATGIVDTVATFWLPELKMERSGDNIMMVPTMLEGQDDWAVGADGRIAVVHRNGYSVDWHYPDGRVVHGPSTPFEAASPTEDDKVAILEERATTGLSMMVGMGSAGDMSMMMRRGGTMSLGGGPNLDDMQWAEEFPPFQDGRAQVSPAGEVWVERMGHVADPKEIDVFDGEGIRIATLELPQGSRVIGFGSAGGGQDVVYVSRMDEVGLWWLERYLIQR